MDMTLIAQVDVLNNDLVDFIKKNYNGKRFALLIYKNESVETEYLLDDPLRKKELLETLEKGSKKDYTKNNPLNVNKKELSTGFKNFIEAKDETGGGFLNPARNKWIDKKPFLEQWRKKGTNLREEKSAKYVHSMLKIYCKEKNIFFFTRNRDSKEAYWVGNKMPDGYPEQSTIKLVVQPTC